MPLWLCNECHHEWEGDNQCKQCSWCKSNGHIIQEKTPLETMSKEMYDLIEKMDK